MVDIKSMFFYMYLASDNLYLHYFSDSLTLHLIAVEDFDKTRQTDRQKRAYKCQQVNGYC